MKVKTLIRKVVGRAFLPFLRLAPIERWPGLFGRLEDIHVPRAVVPSPTRTPAGGVNIRIVFELLEQVRYVEGDVAECGVYRGATLIPMALYLRQHGVEKHVFGFDSFEGFDESVSIDIHLGGRDLENKRIGGLGDTSYDSIPALMRERSYCWTNTTILRGQAVTKP